MTVGRYRESKKALAVIQYYGGPLVPASAIAALGPRSIIRRKNLCTKECCAIGTAPLIVLFARKEEQCGERIYQSTYCSTYSTNCTSQVLGEDYSGLREYISQDYTKENII